MAYTDKKWASAKRKGGMKKSMDRFDTVEKAIKEERAKSLEVIEEIIGTDLKPLPPDVKDEWIEHGDSKVRWEDILSEKEVSKDIDPSEIEYAIKQYIDEYGNNGLSSDDEAVDIFVEYYNDTHDEIESNAYAEAERIFDNEGEVINALTLFKTFPEEVSSQSGFDEGTDEEYCTPSEILELAKDTYVNRYNTVYQRALEDKIKEMLPQLRRKYNF